MWGFPIAWTLRWFGLSLSINEISCENLGKLSNLEPGFVFLYPVNKSFLNCSSDFPQAERLPWTVSYILSWYSRSVFCVLCLIFGILRKEILGVSFPGYIYIYIYMIFFLQRTVLEQRVGMDGQTDRGLLCTSIRTIFIKIWIRTSATYYGVSVRQPVWSAEIQ